MKQNKLTILFLSSIVLIGCTSFAKIVNDPTCRRTQDPIEIARISQSIAEGLEARGYASGTEEIENILQASYASFEICDKSDRLTSRLGRTTKYGISIGGDALYVVDRNTGELVIFDVDHLR